MDSRRSLDFAEGVFEDPDSLVLYVAGGFRRCRSPSRLGLGVVNVILGLFWCVVFSHFHELVHFDVLLDHGVELLPFLLELDLLSFGILLQLCQHNLRTISVLIGTIRRLNDISHLLSPVMKLLLQLLIDVVKNDSLTSQVVNFLPKLLVVRYGLIELLISLLKTIFQDTDLFVECA
jgi:hypothetical protein